MGILTEPLSFTRQHGEPNYIVCSFNHSPVPYQRFYLQCRNTAGQGTTSLVGLSSLPPGPCWLEERPWLRLVTLPSRIWVAKKPVGWEGW